MPQNDPETSPSRFRLICLIAAVLCCLGAAQVWSQGVLRSNGDTSFRAIEARALRKFPPLESIVPMPQNINPANRKRVREYCGVQVYAGREPVAGAKLRFRTKLIVMDNTTNSFRAVPVGTRKVKTDEAGLAFFVFEIPTELFATGFKSGEISAWSHTRAKFTKLRGSYALLSCDLQAKK